MKRLTLAAIVVAAMILWATGTALAGKSDTATYVFTPTGNSGFPNASGSVTITTSGPYWVRLGDLAPDRQPAGTAHRQRHA